MIVGHVIMLLGAVFMLLAAVGSVRMPDLMTRMHSTTKAGAFGAGMMLIGVTLEFSALDIQVRAIAILRTIGASPSSILRVFFMAGAAIGGARKTFRHTEANAPLLVSNNHQGCETEATAALDDLGDAVDVDELVHELAVALLALIAAAAATAFTFTCHTEYPSH